VPFGWEFGGIGNICVIKRGTFALRARLGFLWLKKEDGRTLGMYNNGGLK
jgi:hypothetical protein